VRPLLMATPTLGSLPPRTGRSLVRPTLSGISDRILSDEGPQGSDLSISWAPYYAGRWPWNQALKTMAAWPSIEMRIGEVGHIAAQSLHTVQASNESRTLREGVSYLLGLRRVLQPARRANSRRQPIGTELPWARRALRAVLKPSGRFLFGYARPSVTV